MQGSLDQLTICRAQGLSEDEKGHLRAGLLAVIPQEDSKVCSAANAFAAVLLQLDLVLMRAAAQFAIQVAIIFAKVARVDFPRDWPSLFTDLLAQLQDVSTLLARRTFLVLHHILKELSSKRLASHQKSFAEVLLQRDFTSFNALSASLIAAVTIRKPLDMHVHPLRLHFTAA